MKKKFCFGIICTLVLLLASACTSTSVIPFAYTHTSKDFEILGEVFYESDECPGYIEFLRAARDQYPECDYVIDIMIDQIKTDTTFFHPVSFFIYYLYGMSILEPVIPLGTKNLWIMRGVAIRYK